MLSVNKCDVMIYNRNVTIAEAAFNLKRSVHILHSDRAEFGMREEVNEDDYPIEGIA